MHQSFKLFLRRFVILLDKTSDVCLTCILHIAASIHLVVVDGVDHPIWVACAPRDMHN